MSRPVKDIPEFPPHIDDHSFMFGTTEYLPNYNDLPETYQKGDAPGCKTAEAIFHTGWTKAHKVAQEVFEGTEMVLKTPPEDYEYGLEERDPVLRFQRAIHAHLYSWKPKHEHKIAGVGFLIDHWCRPIQPQPTEGE